MSNKAEHALTLAPAAQQFKCVWCGIYTVRLPEPLAAGCVVRPASDRADVRIWCRCGKGYAITSGA